MFSYKKFLLKNTLIICIIFSLLFIASFYFFEYYSFRASYASDAEQYIETVSANLSDAVYKVNDLSTIFHTKDEFKEYVESSEPNSYMRRIVAQYLFSTISAMPSVTNQIYVTSTSDRYLVSGEAIMTPEYFSSVFDIPYDELKRIISETDRKSIPEPTVILSKGKKADYLTVVARDNRSFINPYLIFSIYNLDKLKTSIPKGDILVLSTDKASVVLSDSEKTEGLEAAVFNGKIPSKYTVLYKKTDYSSPAGIITYTLLMRKSKYLSFLNKYIPYMLPFGIIFFILSYIFANYSASKSHKPIKSILDQISTINPSEQKNEIERISSAISLLVNRNKNLSETANANNTALREKFVNDLMQNNLTEAQITYGINTYLSGFSDSFPLILIIIGVDRFNGEQSVDASEDKYSYYDIIKTLTAKTFGDRSFMHFSTVIPSVYCAVITSKDISESKQALKNMLLNAENDIGISLNATVSENINDWRDLPQVFASAYLTHTTVASGGEHISIVDNSDTDIKFFYSSDIDEKIYKYCIMADKEGLEKTIRTLFSKNFPNDEMFKKNKDPLSLLIYALCTRISTMLNIDSKDIFTDGYNIYLELKSGESKEDFFRKTVFIFNSIINYNINSKTSYEQTYCDKMLSYIHDNYRHNISLADIAEHMNMSQAYVSRLFKKLTKSNFKDYLVKIRLDNATRLLIEQPNLTVSDIALEVGFNTSRTFTNTFSSAFGMTPTEYRHKHLH